MTKTIKRTHHKPYGNCALCGYCGTVQYHHLIPKRLKVKTDIRTKFIYTDHVDGGLKYTDHKARIENLSIQVCKHCHKKLHPENWQFIMNEIQIKKLEALEK